LPPLNSYGDGVALGLGDSATSLAGEDLAATAGTIEKGGSGMPMSELAGRFISGLEEATGEVAVAGVSVDDEGATGCCSGVGDGLTVSEGDASTVGV
jgi:hypothetical protein